jgi:hypothetical protein
MKPIVIPALLLMAALANPEDPSSDWMADLDASCQVQKLVSAKALYDVIDGGATVYLKNGFKKGQFLGCKKEGRTACVEIYEQASVAAADSVWQKTAQGEYRYPGDGREIRIDTSVTFTPTLEFLNGHYFVRIIINQNDSAATAGLLELLEVVSQKLGSGHIPISFPEK